MMPETNPIPIETRDRQRRAFDPARSAFVFANAGSGKTHVLASRVTRLMLEGADPGRLLCLTYTRAAAAEMARRVLTTLARWAVAGEGALADEIEALSGLPPAPAMLRRARGLFAHALDTPGGLKVQTIHAFAERLLHAFPLEADVAAAFSLLSEDEEERLRREACDRALLAGLSGRDASLTSAARVLLAALSDDGLAEHLKTLSGKAEILAPYLGEDGPARFAAACRAYLGLEPGREAEAVSRDMAQSPFLAASVLAAVRRAVSAHGKDKAIDFEKRLLGACEAADPASAADLLLGAFFTAGGSGTPKALSSCLNKDALKSEPQLEPLILEEQQRLEALREELWALRVLERSSALFTMARAVIADIERAKAARGLLSFSDLVERTAGLLTRQGAAEWVRYKLDAGIDHVLVDEAQDTSAAQWAIIGALVEDFFAGETSRAADRTVFAVGDPKQSIYSFQGAAPQLFRDIHARLSKRAGGAGKSFETVPLTLSFRSSPEVLKSVDAVFARKEARAGVALEDEAVVHQAQKPMPGRVEVWPVFFNTRADEPERWTETVEAETAAVPRLAECIAERIRAEIARGVPPGEIMVLMRARKALFRQLSRSLKAKGLPVAGLDRFTLTDEIAVRDMMALFSVLLLPEDDLSLAALLKSPVFELDDAALEVLAAPRKATLFQALRHAAETDPALAAILADLDFWRARADFDRPYELAMRVLASGGRRGRFRQRLGSEVDDVLDAFLAFLLEIESEGAETLQAALARLEAGTGESKRDLDVAGDSVRIVTVHSAKGLEARVVFLCETMGKASKVNAASMLFPQASGEAAMPPFLIAGADAASKAVKDTMAFMVARDEEEYRRLLYVAMTRAEEQLIVTGHYNTQKPGPGHWYGLVRDALEADGRLEAREGFDEPVLVFDRDGTPPPGGKTGSEPHAAAPTLPVPAIIRSALGPAPAAPPVPLRLAASGTESEEGEAKGGRAALEALQTPERALALKRGTLAHHLFQHLPAIAPVERRARALAFLAREGLAADAASALQAEVEAVMAAPEAALLFSGAARAEVAVAGTLLARDGTQRPVLGRIDRLVIEPDRVVIADFKTASSPPAPDALPVSILRQMALYRALLKPRFTDRTIEAAILWTAGPRLDWIAPQTLDVALEQLLHTNCGE